MAKQRTIRRGARVPLALALALSALVMFSVVPASAYTVVSDTGTHGAWTFDDTTESPPVTCTYGQAQPPFEIAHLHMVKVRPPSAFAVNKTGGRDSQKMSWQFKLQGEEFGTGDNWQTFAQSSVQKVTGHDDTPAPFSPMKIAYNARHNPDPNSENFVYQTLIIVTWYKANGSVGGTVKLLPTYYRVKSPFSPPHIAGGSYCGAISTAG